MTHYQFPKKNSHLQTNCFGVLKFWSNIVKTMLHDKKKFGRNKKWWSLKFLCLKFFFLYYYYDNKYCILLKSELTTSES